MVVLFEEALISGRGSSNGALESSTWPRFNKILIVIYSWKVLRLVQIKGELRNKYLSLRRWRW